MDSEYRIAFIDTNLDTRLAFTVSTHDDIAEIKRKILSEHPKCFPEIGQIQVHRIKVKRKGYFYHLSDSLLVRSALKPFQKDWFLTADVSALGDCRQNEMLVSDRVDSLGIENNNALVGTHDNSIKLPQLENKQDASEQIHVGRVAVLGDTAKEGEQITLPVSIPETEDRRRVNHEVPSSCIEGEVERSGNGNNNTLVGTHDNSIKLPQLENKQDESEQIHVGRVAVLGDTAKEGKQFTLPVSIPETEDRRLVNHEVPSSRIEGEVERSAKGNTDEPSFKRRRRNNQKSENREKEYSMGGDNSEDNISSVGNPLSCERASSFNNLQVPQPKNRHDEKEEIQGLCVLERTRKEAVQHLEMLVKSSGNKDRNALFPSSIADRQDNCSSNHGLPNSLIECEVDGSNKGTEDVCSVGEEGTSKPAPSPKKKHKTKKRKKEDKVQDDTSKENDTYVVVPGYYTVQQDVVVLANSSAEIFKEYLHPECIDKCGIYIYVAH